MVKSLKLRTVDNTEIFDPVRNLWKMQLKTESIWMVTMFLNIIL